MNCAHVIEEENARWTGAVLMKCVACNRRRFYAKKMARCSACHGFVHKRCLRGQNDRGDVSWPVAEDSETTDVRETVSATAAEVAEEESESSPKDSDCHSTGGVAFPTTSSSFAEPVTAVEVAKEESESSPKDSDCHSTGGVAFPTTSSFAEPVTAVEVAKEESESSPKDSNCHSTGGVAFPTPSSSFAEPMTAEETTIVISATADREHHSVIDVGPAVVTEPIECSAANKVGGDVVVENTAGAAAGSGVEPTGSSYPSTTVKKSAAAKRRAKKKAKSMMTPRPDTVSDAVDSNSGENGASSLPPKIAGLSAKEIDSVVTTAAEIADDVIVVTPAVDSGNDASSFKDAAVKKSAAAKRRARKKATSAAKSTTPAVSVDRPVLAAIASRGDTDRIESTSGPAAKTVAEIADNDGGAPSPATVRKSAAARRRAKKKARSGRNEPEAKDPLLPAAVGGVVETTSAVDDDDVTVSAEIRAIENADQKSADDLFDRLRTSTNPWTIELKDSEVFGYSPTRDFIDLIDEIESDEGLSVSFEIIVSGLAGHEMVKLVVSPDVEYLGSGDTYELAQKSAAFSFLKDLHLKFKE